MTYLLLKINAILITVSLKTYRATSKFGGNIRLTTGIKKIIRSKGIKKLTSKQRRDIKSFYRELELPAIDTSWHRAISGLSGNFNVAYLPENLFYLEIEPKLNSRKFAETFSDKNYLDKILSGIKKPRTLLRCVNGYRLIEGHIGSREEVLERLEGPGELVFKPALDSWGGANVKFLKKGNTPIHDHRIAITELLDYMGRNFIVQEGLKQHKEMSLLNPTSVNTYRIMTYLNDEGVQVLSTLIRIGRKGSRTDNLTQGGLVVGISGSGQCNPIGIVDNGTAYTMTDTNIPFQELQVSFNKKVGDKAVELHQQVPHFRLISWDFAIDEEGELVLIEYNIKGQGIIGHQLNNGPILLPVLRDYKKFK